MPPKELRGNMCILGSKIAPKRAFQDKIIIKIRDKSGFMGKSKFYTKPIMQENL